MNDDFLYRIRTEPPAHFATALKERLDSAPRRRRARATRFGLGVLLFGTAFAMVVPGVRQSLLALISPEDNTPIVVARGTEAPRTPPTARPVTEEDSSSEGAGAAPLGESVRERSSMPVRPAIPPRTVAPAIVDNGDEPLDEKESNDLSPVTLLARSKAITPDDLFSSVIPATPWPIVARDATEAAAVIETRRALFRVIAYNYNIVDAASRARRDLNRDSIALSAYRLLQLSAMIDDAYAIDARRWTDVESANALVWNQRVLFRKQIEEFSESARALLEAAAKGSPADVINAANRVRHSCWQCHEEFSYRRDLPPRG